MTAKSTSAARPPGRVQSRGTRATTSHARIGPRTATAAIFSTKLSPTATPTTTRQRRASGSCSPFQKASDATAQSRSPGVSVPAMWPSP